MADLKNSYKELPTTLKNILPLIAAALGIAALWFAWTRYTEITTAPPTVWTDWARMVSQAALFAVAGAIWVVSAGLLLAKKPVAWPTFLSGFYVVVAILVINLVLLAATGVMGLFNGQIAAFFSEHGNVFLQPQTYISTVVILAIIAIITVLDKKNKRNKK